MLYFVFGILRLIANSNHPFEYELEPNNEPPQGWYAVTRSEYNPGLYTQYVGDEEPWLSQLYLPLGAYIEWPKEFDFQLYFLHERELLNPLLLSAGFTEISWHMGESDSFGPLTRFARATYGNKRYQLVYG